MSSTATKSLAPSGSGTRGHSGSEERVDRAAVGAAEDAAREQKETARAGDSSGSAEREEEEEDEVEERREEAATLPTPQLARCAVVVMVRLAC